ncbi:hypothetical protein NPIL_236051 [Nephila pilipes]|uniref:Uncharacterized protein n=1 Tax=Nephila pilipes TaxID=299642 RepID=A0A8X6PDR9_NEPPI|nr:hypothetical protein NPIL_236051 [Nephila pilipes]
MHFQFLNSFFPLKHNTNLVLKSKQHGQNCFSNFPICFKSRPLYLDRITTPRRHNRTLCKTSISSGSVLPFVTNEMHQSWRVPKRRKESSDAIAEGKSPFALMDRACGRKLTGRRFRARDLTIPGPTLGSLSRIDSSFLLETREIESLN